MISPITCVLPAYQVASTLGTVADGLRRALPSATLVAVDDGSTDPTYAVAAACCDRVLRFERNRGKGAALRAGFADALAHGAQAVVTVDADGQHDPMETRALVDALETADLAIGARARRGTAMPLSRRVTNGLASRAMSACARTPLADAQSGYRAMRRDVLLAVQADGDRYEFESDFLLRAVRQGFRIANVPVTTIYGAPSHFQLLRDAGLVMRTIWRNYARSTVPVGSIPDTGGAG